MIKRAASILLVAVAMTSPTHAEGPVYFADPNLKARVEETLLITDPTPTDMLALYLREPD